MRSDNEIAEPDHWSERGRATAVSNSDAGGRPRRSVLSLDQMSTSRDCDDVSEGLTTMVLAIRDDSERGIKGQVM